MLGLDVALMDDGMCPLVQEGEELVGPGEAWIYINDLAVDVDEADFGVVVLGS